MPLKKIARKAHSVRRKIPETARALGRKTLEKARELRMRAATPKPGTPEYAEWLATAPYADVLKATLMVEKKRRASGRKAMRTEEERRLVVGALEWAINLLRMERRLIAARATTVADSMRMDEISALISHLEPKLDELKRQKQR